MPRFVLLEHAWNGVHWDLLLETAPDGSLRSWAIDAPIAFHVDLPARDLKDHRAIYLDYEGPISGDRGTVKRIDRGVYEPLIWTPDHVKVQIRGNQLEGLVELRMTGESGSWSFRLGNVD